MGGPTPSERADDGIDASVCARSEAQALIPRPSAAYPPPEDAARPDLMTAVMKTTVRVSKLLAQGVDVRGSSHPNLYHLVQLLSRSLRRCSSWCVTHGPKRKEVTCDPVVAAVVLRYSL